MADRIDHKDSVRPIEQTLTADLAQYRTFENASSRDNTSVASSGERLRTAAENYEHTLAQDPFVKDLAEKIKTGQPGTPEWDELMKVVEKQLLSNEKQVGSIQSGMADTSQKVAMYTGRADVSQQFGDVHIV